MGWDVLTEGGCLICDRMWQTGVRGSKNREKCGRCLWTAPWWNWPNFQELYFFPDAKKNFTTAECRKRMRKQTVARLFFCLGVIHKWRHNNWIIFDTRIITLFITKALVQLSRNHWHPFPLKPWRHLWTNLTNIWTQKTGFLLFDKVGLLIQTMLNWTWTHWYKIHFCSN